MDTPVLESDPCIVILSIDLDIFPFHTPACYAIIGILAIIFVKYFEQVVETL